MPDYLLTRSYNMAARVGRLGNSFSHIVLALSQTIQEARKHEASGADPSAPGLAGAVAPVGGVSTVPPFSSSGPRSDVWTSCSSGPGAKCAGWPSQLAACKLTACTCALLITLNHVQVDNRGASASLHRLTSAIALCHGRHFRCQEVRRPAAAPPRAPRGRGGRC